MCRCDLYIEAFPADMRFWLKCKKTIKIGKTVYSLQNDGRIKANLRFLSFHNITKYYKLFKQEMNK